jgi:hypothetical protein
MRKRRRGRMLKSDKKDGGPIRGHWHNGIIKRGCKKEEVKLEIWKIGNIWQMPSSILW